MNRDGMLSRVAGPRHNTNAPSNPSLWVEAARRFLQLEARRAFVFVRLDAAALRTERGHVEVDDSFDSKCRMIRNTFKLEKPLPTMGWWQSPYLEVKQTHLAAAWFESERVNGSAANWVRAR